jgi:hypothetical protein
MGYESMPTQEEMKKSRAENDTEMVREGANVVPGEDRDRIEVTGNQEDMARAEMTDDQEAALTKENRKREELIQDLSTLLFSDSMKKTIIRRNGYH